MQENIGKLINQLINKDNDMWDNQEALYNIRKMTFEEFSIKYFESKDGAEELWKILKKCCDLNVERSDLIDKIDNKITGMILKT